MNIAKGIIKGLSMIGAVAFYSIELMKGIKRKKIIKVLEIIRNGLFVAGMYVYLSTMLVGGSTIGFLLPSKISGKFSEYFFSPLRFLIWLDEKITEKRKVKTPC